MQGWSEVPRGTALFDSILVFENYPIERAAREAPAQSEVIDAHFFERVHYPLCLLASPGSTLSLRLSYDRRRFGSEAMDRLLQHYRELLEGIVQRPEARLGELEMLTSREHEQVVEEWNATQRDYGETRCVHELFEEQARRHPHRTAVVHEGCHLSYGELDRRQPTCSPPSAQGVGPDVLVALCVDRSLEMVVALLAVLSTAGPCPLGPDYPARLAFMLQDSGAKILFSQARLSRPPLRRLHPRS